MLERLRKLLTITGAIILAVLTITSCTTNWSQFRGPEQNMLVQAKNLPAEWGEETNIRWTADIEADSWSSPVVWGNKVFVASAVPVKVAAAPKRRQGPATEEEEDESYLNDIYRWQLSCIDLDTGEESWKRVAYEGNPRIKKHRAHNYAGETPVTDGERIYVYFGMTGIYCYDLDGNLLWEKDPGVYETLYGWGTGASPVLHEGTLFLQVDNEENSFLLALNAATGDEIWTVDRDEKTNYSTPLIWKNTVRTELVTGGKRARSYDPVTGTILWELKVEGCYNIPSPVADKDFLYLGNTAFRDTPGSFQCIRAGASGDITPAEGEATSSGVVWTIADAPTANPSPLLYQGLIYLVSGRGGQITCIEASAGEQVYQEKIEKVGACWSSPWAFEDKIFFTDEKGVTRVFRAGEEFELLHENSLDGKFWSSVAVAGDAFLFKGVDKLYCIGY
ncbi:MAG: PQQ-binding-like beta-propeller repeat protein [Bacteroidetes bacterium]|nr:PQQ-binding-like beta-propeller repeat protein [Bacteroidota bacterium]